MLPKIPKSILRLFAALAFLTVFIWPNTHYLVEDYVFDYIEEPGTFYIPSPEERKKT